MGMRTFAFLVTLITTITATVAPLTNSTAPTNVGQQLDGVDNETVIVEEVTAVSYGML